MINYRALALLVGLMPAVANAGQFATQYGEIVAIRSYSYASDDNNQAPAGWASTFIQVSGISLHATCPHADWGKGDLNYWSIDAKDRHTLSIALAAYSAKRKIKITSNDSPGFDCRIVYLDVQD